VEDQRHGSFRRSQGWGKIKNAKKHCSNIQVEVFWVVMPCSFVVGHQNFRGSCCLYLQCILLQHYTASQHRRRPESSPPWKPQNCTVL